MVGGGELVAQFTDAGLLDEILLGIAPVMLGASTMGSSPFSPTDWPGKKTAADLLSPYRRTSSHADADSLRPERQ